MAGGEEASRISLQVSRGIVVASIQTDLEEGVLSRFQRDVLDRIHAVEARGLVLELSGLETLDPEEFEGLRRVMRMARIMGTESVLVGLSPGIVSALVTSGADVDGLRATLDIDEALGMFDEPEIAEPEEDAPETAEPQAVEPQAVERKAPAEDPLAGAEDSR
jgi:rsbT antagonist protein RsbS